MTDRATPTGDDDPRAPRPSIFRRAGDGVRSLLGLHRRFTGRRSEHGLDARKGRSRGIQRGDCLINLPRLLARSRQRDAQARLHGPH